MLTTKQGGLTAITTGKTTIIVGPADFDEADFRPLVETLDLPVFLSSKAWDYAEEGDLVIWSVTRD